MTTTGLSEAKQRKIRDNYEAATSVRKLATLSGLSRQRVTEFLKAEGLPYPDDHGGHRTKPEVVVADPAADPAAPAAAPRDDLDEQKDVAEVHKQALKVAAADTREQAVEVATTTIALIRQIGSHVVKRHLKTAERLGLEPVELVDRAIHYLLEYGGDVKVLEAVEERNRQLEELVTFLLAEAESKQGRREILKEAVYADLAGVDLGRVERVVDMVR